MTDDPLHLGNYMTADTLCGATATTTARMACRRWREQQAALAANHVGRAKSSTSPRKSERLQRGREKTMTRYRTNINTGVASMCARALPTCWLRCLRHNAKVPKTGMTGISHWRERLGPGSLPIRCMA